jgi:hypothetical protein
MSVSAATTVISLTGSTISIFSLNQLDVGLYTVTITGTLSNGVTKSTSFILDMIPTKNTPPYFSPPLKD